MGINVSAAQGNASRLRSLASELKAIEGGLKTQRLELQQAWQSSEVHFLNIAIDRITAELTSIANELDGLGGDIVSVANEIRNEEIAAEARRLAEEMRQRQLAEAEAKAKGNNPTIIR